MLICVGMYLKLETTFAIFIGGLIRGIVDMIADKRKCNAAQKGRIENTGILLASGLIAGEALTNMVFGGFEYYEWKVSALIQNPSFVTSLFVFVLIGLVLSVIPLRNAGRPDEPAPPSAVV